MGSKIIIDASNFTVNKWLKLLFQDRKSVTPNTYFPNETAKDEYLRKIKNISESKVKDLLLYNPIHLDHLLR